MRVLDGPVDFIQQGAAEDVIKLNHYNKMHELLVLKKEENMFFKYIEIFWHRFRLKICFLYQPGLKKTNHHCSLITIHLVSFCFFKYV